MDAALRNRIEGIVGKMFRVVRVADDLDAMERGSRRPSRRSRPAAAASGIDFVGSLGIGEYGGQRVTFIQPKLNGYFCEIYKRCGRVTAWLKNRKTDIWPLLSQIESIRRAAEALPDESVIWGELHHPDLPATSVVSWMNEGNPALRFTAFAMPQYRGKDMSGWGIKAIECLLAEHGVDYVKSEPVAAVGELLARAGKLKIEGYVLKASHMAGWYKLKPVQTVDAVVCGYKLSMSDTFRGGLKSFAVGVYDEFGMLRRVADVPSGFTTEFRMSCKPCDYRGRVMEVAYQSVTDDGKLLFPRFLRWRDEKEAVECLEGQLN